MASPGTVESIDTSASSPVVLVVDGNSLAHRAYHAYQSRSVELTDTSNRPTSTTYGFLALLAGIADKVRAHHSRLDAVIVGFDDATSSVRKTEYPLYKAQREKKDPDLYRQMNDLISSLPKLGVTVIVPAGLEADDVVGSVAATAEARSWRCVIATSDRDSFSQISSTTTVLRLLSGLDNAVWLDQQALVEKYGVHPSSYTFFAALRGDVSDNLPGVHGVGEKRAAALVAKYASIDEALADFYGAQACLGKKGAATLATKEAQEAVARNLSLMRIRRDLSVDLDQAVITIDPNAVVAQLEQMGFPTLAHRLPAALSVSSLADNCFDHDNFEDLDAAIDAYAEFDRSYEPSDTVIEDLSRAEPRPVRETPVQPLASNGKEDLRRAGPKPRAPKVPESQISLF